ncbi:DNA polymerase delta subunit 4 isoform X2 [Stigmatopora nigra]
MPTKDGLITSSFKVVKKTKHVVKRDEKSPSPTQDAEISSLNQDQEKLRQFDLDWKFGPCTGISRLQRWERAKLHGLNPPEDIRDLLLLKQDGQDYNLSLWSEHPL